MSFNSNFTIPAVTVIGFYLIGGTVPAPAYADLGDQLFKLLPNDGAAEEFFGCSVAISGATAIVGAYWDDENGSRSGSAYLFGTSDPANPTQLFKLLPDDGAEGDYFGLSVAISGLTAISGARYDDDNGDLSGSAYLFHTSTGRQIAKLLPDDGAAGDVFGHSVAISGATAIVGAHLDDDNGDSSGAAYLFDTTTGRQIAKLLPDDGAMGDAFGQSVAIGGAPGKEVAIIGAPSDDDNGPSSGVAYVFRFDPETQRWVEEQKLLPADGAGGDRFGWSVAINGATAIIGAIWNDDNGTESGSAYLFDISDPANPVQTAKLLPIDGAALDYFGVSVTLSGDTAIIGARHDDDNGANSGSAYLFDITTGKQITKLLPNDGEAGDKFGGSVAISGATGKVTAIVGARLDDDNGSDSGSAYLFDAAVPGMCPWDLDDNGVVGASDLLSLLGSWGPCKGCPADFDANGNVGASDLLALLANWGVCP